VAKDSVIGTFFYGDVSQDKLKELAVIDKKIKTASSNQSEYTSSEFDSSNVENNISKRENDIIDAARENDIYAISGYKDDINSLRARNELSDNNNLTELENQKKQLISSIGLTKDDITAQISGVLTTYTDGYEDSLVPNDIEKYDVAYFNSLEQSAQNIQIADKVGIGGAVCKIVNNHLWYVMVEVPSDTMKNRKEGDSVKLRFKNAGNEVVKGTIANISKEQDGKVVVTIKSSAYTESVFSYRLVDVDLIFESYDGYKVPIQAIRTDDNGKQKVIGINGSNQYNCYCNVLYTNTEDGYAIVESVDDAEYKLSQMDRVQVGER
jgi:putative membrane fusion protein